MFETLSERLSTTLNALTGKGVLTDENITSSLREVRLALLEADVALSVVKDFITNINSDGNFKDNIINKYTNDDNLADQCRAIRIHGTINDKYNSELIGLNGRLDSMQAAILLEKLTIFDEELILRENVSKQYRNNLDNCQYIPKNYTSSHALFSVVLESFEKRKMIINKLKKHNIPNVIYYKTPIHLMKAFSYLGYQKGDFPVSERLKNTILSLPMHPYLSNEEVKLVITNLD